MKIQRSYSIEEVRQMFGGRSSRWVKRRILAGEFGPTPASVPTSKPNSSNPNQIRRPKPAQPPSLDEQTQNPIKQPGVLK